MIYIRLDSIEIRIKIFVRHIQTSISFWFGTCLVDGLECLSMLCAGKSIGCAFFKCKGTETSVRFH